MCAILGMIKIKKVSKEELKRIADVMNYRGPDEEGYFIEENIGLGHKRLSIIDLQTGKQPLFNEDGNLVLVCNGEIYNFIELKKKLEEKGHVFKTKSDSEVILHLYEDKKEKCLDDLRGMFAFGIWDRKNKTLFLARDRIGKKPLVYAIKNGNFYFSSELKGLLEVPEIEKEIDYFALDDFFTYQAIPSPKTIFKDIRKLPPGHYLLWKNGDIKIERYWEIDFTKKIYFKDENEYKEVLWEKLKEATKIRLISDVPLGAFLSGGIDSSTVVGIMSELVNQPVKTFSVGFDIESFNELKYAKIVAKKFNTEHYEFIVKPDIIEILPKLVWYYNEPFGDSSMIPTYYVAQQTSKYVKVALNGDGGDENFAGYPRYYQTKILEKLYMISKKTGLLNKKTKKLFEKLYQKRPYFFPIRVLKWLQEADNNGFCYAYSRRLTSFSPEWKNKLYSKEFKNILKSYDSFKITENLWEKAGNIDLLEKMMFCDFNLYLPEVLLVKMDIACMANSIEGRSPFLDIKFIELIASFPPNLKLNGQKTKYILKEKLNGFLPDEILKRKKMGFGVPLRKWFQNELKGYLKELILSDNFRKVGLLEYKTVENIFKEHIDGKVDHSSRLFLLLTFELWRKVYKIS
ncbi:MAG: asparagine synthase (glutamine-hydrolyzing) [bacterium]|nr:asparagine synthase (glutamine-hydrolyzing) [bacterium]MDW8164206.1 asparagine synthase (glutamine-hydrolyzing) [Candidatus Omnitrophota bacterium]